MSRHSVARLSILCGEREIHAKRSHWGQGQSGFCTILLTAGPCEKNVCHQPQKRTIACLRGIQPEAVWREIEPS